MTVNNYLKKPNSSQTTHKRNGRPRKLSERHIRYIVRQFELGIFRNARDACNQLLKDAGIAVEKTTIARVLRSAGLKSYSKPKKPRLLLYHKKQRLDFARLMKNFPPEAWKSVIFSDESKICTFGPDGNNRAWRRPTKILKDHHVTQTVKFGGKSVMVWGAISYHGVGQLRFIDTKMDSAGYIAILDSGYFGTLDMHGFDVSNSALQQDNDPKHLSAMTRSWLIDHDIKVLKWPSCSPDLNIIENLWYYLKVRVSSVEDKPKNVDELKAVIKRIWEQIPLSYVQSLYDSISERLDQVIKSKGGYTSY